MDAPTTHEPQVNGSPGEYLKDQITPQAHGTSLSSSLAATEGIANELPQTVSSTISHLPQEIIEYILTFVSDIETLRNCCLTSSSFLSQSQSLMLRHAHLSPSNYDKLYPQLKSFETKAKAVRHLELTGFHAPPMPVRFRPKEFEDVIVLLSRVEQVSFTRMMWDIGDTSALPFQSSRAASVTSVSLHTTHVELLSQFLALLSVFPNLAKLSMFNVVWTTSDHDKIRQMKSLLARTPRLQDIDVQSTSSSLVQWLFPAEEQARLTSMAIEAQVGADDSWWALLERVRHRVEHLTIHKCWQRPYLSS